MGGRPATVEDLYRVPGKAELVDGELVIMTSAGGFTALLRAPSSQA